MTRSDPDVSRWWWPLVAERLGPGVGRAESWDAPVDSVRPDW